MVLKEGVEMARLDGVGGAAVEAAEWEGKSRMRTGQLRGQSVCGSMD